MQVYRTHYNGGTPFAVMIDSPSAIIYQIDFNDMNKEVLSEIMTFEYKKVHIGKQESCECSACVGNTILFEMSDTSMRLVNGESITDFSLKTGDTIEAYHSHIGPNDVPYPVLVGKNFIYLLFADVCMNRADFDLVDYGDEYVANEYYHMKKKDTMTLKNFMEIYTIHK